jgi:hypothetical protein
MKLANQAKQTAKQIEITIDDFSGGSNSLMDEARMPPKFAVGSTNLLQVQDAVWKTRWGTKYYGAEFPDNPDGGSEYVKSDGTTELIVIADGKAYKSTDGGTITEVTGATFTAGLPCYFMQIAGYLYIANGTDNLARYDGSVLTTYTEISAPTNLAASRTASGLTSGVYGYYAEVTALNDVGETVGSTEASISTNKLRDNWTPSTDKIVWSWTAASGASRYQLYLADESGDETLLTSVTTTNFTDDGSLDLNPYVVPPLQNTTTAPKFKSMCVSGNRIWATNDSNAYGRYTVYWSGTGQFMGNFSDFYGGGWINLEKGGAENPVAVKHYQSGTGDGRPTVLCKTPNGRGAVWQLTIATATVGDTSFAIPSATKVVGSFGTESINGVVATNNDIAFPNRKGWFSLGPEKNYYGILRTNEKSSNIRPYWRSLISGQIDEVCAYFYDAKIFISVPTSTAGNDRIIVYDTERTNWSVDWSVGAKQFLEYTDSSLNTHFLLIPTSGTRLIEMSENYQNDLGVAFNQSYISPLLPVSKTKTDIMNLKEAIVELGRPKGSINFSILGIGKDNSFATIATKTISSFGSNTGVGTDLVGTTLLSTTQSVPYFDLTPVDTWFDSLWGFRKKITIDHTKVSADLTNFPVLISVTDTDLAEAQADGDDFIFTDSTNARLSHEIESWTDDSGILTAWVRVPALSSTTDTVLYLYYGNADCSSQEDVAGVWDTDYASVYHMNDLTTSTVQDSVGGLNGTKTAATEPTEASAKIGNGQNFDGANDIINCGAVDIGDNTDKTVELWVKRESDPTTYTRIYQRNKSASALASMLVVDTGVGKFAAIFNDGTEMRQAFGVVDTNWHHLVAVYDESAATVTCYMDGVLASGVTTGGWIFAANDNLYLGGRGDGTKFFDGSIDEVRFSNIARSAEWILTEYNNQNSPSDFYEFGAEEVYDADLYGDVYELRLLASPSSFTQATTKGAIRKRAKLYALQFKVSSQTADTNFTILSLQAKGRLIPRRMPSSWLN